MEPLLLIVHDENSEFIITRDYENAPKHLVTSFLQFDS